VAVAVLGALLGGLVMYAAGSATPETARTWLIHVPGIHPPLIGRVQTQLAGTRS